MPQQPCPGHKLPVGTLAGLSQDEAPEVNLITPWLLSVHVNSKTFEAILK